ncbi:hypothetical protein K466DRAFT_43067 [Polyporus arcularius HHB13444]|uniref:Uncharacterized protein n=1 Tax=Polyporus arcularius HHB13444 TaxID=1314778 RepID=A0A5C3NSN0_9APHY|nr:hypothetical protein K466DRAFT_43067 [Polyporus arcularius HHB13444]
MESRLTAIKLVHPKTLQLFKARHSWLCRSTPPSSTCASPESVSRRPSLTTSNPSPRNPQPLPGPPSPLLHPPPPKPQPCLPRSLSSSTPCTATSPSVSTASSQCLCLQRV